MRLLVDAHALIWFVDQDHRLSSAARQALMDPANDTVVSAGTIWEIAIKVALRKLTLSGDYQAWMTSAIQSLSAVLLPITVEHAHAQIALAQHHRDPFDRLLVAQAQVEALTIISADSAFDPYGVARIW